MRLRNRLENGGIHQIKVIFMQVLARPGSMSRLKTKKIEVESHTTNIKIYMIGANYTDRNWTVHFTHVHIKGSLET